VKELRVPTGTAAAPAPPSVIRPSPSRRASCG